MALVSRDASADRQRGIELLTHVREMWIGEGDLFYGIPLLDLYVARESASSGDRDGAIPVMRKAVDGLLRAGRLPYGVIGAGILVETLLEGGAEGDLAEAQVAIDRLANRRQQKIGRYCRSRCCGCVRCWLVPAARMTPTRTW